jgi:hypothetical protein
MAKIKLWIAQLFCLHNWEQDMLAIYGKGILKSYKCKKCGKVSYYFTEPISYIK